MSDSVDLRRTIAVVAALAVVGAVPGFVLLRAPGSLSYRIRGLSLLAFAAALVLLALGVGRRLLLSSWPLHESAVRIAADSLASLALLAYAPLALGLFRSYHSAFYLGIVGLPGAILYFVHGRRSLRSVLTRRRIQVATAALLLVGVGLVGYDVTGPDVSYEERAHEDPDVYLREEPESSGASTVPATVGLLVYEVRNDFPYARPLKIPDYEACVVGDERGVVQHVDVDTLIPIRFFDERIDGRERGSIDVSADLRLRVTDGEPPDLAVERGSDCTGDRDQPTILFWKAAEHRPVPYDDDESSGAGSTDESAAS